MVKNQDGILQALPALCWSHWDPAAVNANPLHNPLSTTLQGLQLCSPFSPKGSIRFLYLSESLPQEASQISPWPSAAGLGRGPQLAPQAWVERKLFGLSPGLLHQGAGGGAGSHRGLGLHSSRLPPPPTAV